MSAETTLTTEEEEWIRSELIRDPSLPEAALRTILHERHRKAARRTAEAAEIARLVEAGAEPTAARQVMAERDARLARKRRDDDLAKARRILAEGQAVAPTPPNHERLRRRGRPKGTRTHRRSTLVDTFHSLRANWGRIPTQQELCDNLEPRIEIRTLQDHLEDYGLSWPIE